MVGDVTYETRLSSFKCVSVTLWHIKAHQKLINNGEDLKEGPIHSSLRNGVWKGKSACNMTPIP